LHPVHRKHQCVVDCRYGDKCRYCGTPKIEQSANSRLLQGPAPHTGFDWSEIDRSFFRLYDANGEYLSSVVCAMLGQAVGFCGNYHTMKVASYLLCQGKRYSVDPIHLSHLKDAHEDFGYWTIADVKFTNYSPLRLGEISHLDEARLLPWLILIPRILARIFQPLRLGLAII
jgi:hypothetical protein